MTGRSIQEPEARGAGSLVICATPIGNLEDITLRVLATLREADVVYAEDTRVTGKLLASYEIPKRLERLDEETFAQQMPRIADRIRKGETVAYCSDAGMPGVSDPGLRLVEAARQAGLSVQVLPGASASQAAYVASGFLSPHYYFGGFFPRKDSERRKVLASVKDLDAVLVFYESPKRVLEALSALAESLPHREVALCRELTKMHEEVYRARAEEVYAEFFARAQNGPIKGEIVLVVDAPPADELAANEASLAEEAVRRADDLIAQGGMTKKEVTRHLQEEFGIARNTAYRIVLSSVAHDGKD